MRALCTVYSECLSLFEMTYLVLLCLSRLGGQKLLEGCVPVTVLSCRGAGCTGRAWITARCVRGVRPRRRTARTNALVHFATGVMIFRVTSQTPGVAVRLSAALGLALEWLFVPVRQHVTVPVGTIIRQII